MGEEDSEGMHYLYHNVSAHMLGDTLYPLNQLKETHPDIYAKHAEKYRGREQLLERRIPKLECLWNDVIFFTPIHPQEIKEALVAAQHPWRQPSRWLKIDAEKLDPERTVIWTYPAKDEAGLQFDEVDILDFSARLLSSYTHMPETTKRYYAKMAEQKLFPLRFVYTPHILHRGPIPLALGEVIEID